MSICIWRFSWVSEFTNSDAEFLAGDLLNGLKRVLQAQSALPDIHTIFIVPPEPAVGQLFEDVGDKLEFRGDGEAFGDDIPDLHRLALQIGRVRVEARRYEGRSGGDFPEVGWGMVDAVVVKVRHQQPCPLRNTAA